MLAGQHLTTSGFSYIQTIYAALGRGASDAVMQAFPNLIPITLPSYVVPVTAETINPWWISGYLTLYCSFGLSVTAGGWGSDYYRKFQHSFDVSFKIIALPLAQVISEYIGIQLYVRSDNLRVDVMSQSMEHAQNVIGFFDSYPLQSYKADQYAIWRKYVDTLGNEMHFGKRNEVGSATILKYIALSNKLDRLNSMRERH